MITGTQGKRKAGYTLEGVGDVNRRLDDAKIKNKVNAIRKALRFASSPIKKDARNYAPEDTGELAASIGYQNPRSPRELWIYVGPDIKKRGVYHAHLVEFGTGPRKYKSPQYRNLSGGWAKVTHTGSMPAQPYMRPAFEKNKTKVSQRFDTKIRRLVKKEFRR